MKTISVSLLITALLLLAACGPTTYVQQPYDQGYNQGYVQPYYDPGATIVIVGGQRGYYGANHIFYSSVTVGGAEGYYDSSHRFVSSSTVVREAAQSKKPMYAGPSGSQFGPSTRSGSTQTQSTATKPDYGSGGTIGRSTSTTTTTTTTSKPSYGSGGTIGRSSSPSSSRPSYGSSGGSISRSRR